MFEAIKEAMGIFKSTFSGTKKDVERICVVPCECKDCMYFLIYNIATDKANYLDQFPQALLSCIFCARFNRQDLYLHKGYGK